MRSRWYRSRPRSSSRATRSRRRASRSAASRTSRGAIRRPKRRCAASAPTRATFARAADILLRDAKGFGHNAFKIELARRAIVRALTQAARGTPQIAVRQENPVSAMTTYIGTATSRVDGRAKVTGAAKYAGEFNVARPRPWLASSTSTIAKGRIARIDASEALARRRRDRRAHPREPAAAWPTPTRPTRTTSPRKGSPFRPLYDDRILFNGQPIALVLAEDSETARFAASLVRVEYEQRSARHRPACAARARPSCVEKPRRKPRGDAAKAFAAADGAPRGRVFHPDRASQSDGAVRLDGDLGRRRQAHGLRQDAGRAERAALSLRRVRA